MSLPLKKYIYIKKKINIPKWLILGWPALSPIKSKYFHLKIIFMQTMGVQWVPTVVSMA